MALAGNEITILILCGFHTLFRRADFSGGGVSPSGALEYLLYDIYSAAMDPEFLLQAAALWANYIPNVISIYDHLHCVWSPTGLDREGAGEQKISEV